MTWKITKIPHSSEPLTCLGARAADRGGVLSGAIRCGIFCASRRSCIEGALSMSFTAGGPSLVREELWKTSSVQCSRAWKGASKVKPFCRALERVEIKKEVSPPVRMSNTTKADTIVNFVLVKSTGPGEGKKEGTRVCKMETMALSMSFAFSRPFTLPPLVSVCRFLLR